jgi:hypothetical protein
VKNLLGMIAAITCLFLGSALADTDKVVLVRGSENKISNFTRSSDDVHISDYTSKGQTKKVLVFKGNFARKGWSLFYRSSATAEEKIHELRTNGDSNSGSFTIKIPLIKEMTHLDFSVIGPLGEVEDESVDIQLIKPAPQKAVADIKISKNRDRLFSNGVVEITWIDEYGEPFLASMNAKSNWVWIKSHEDATNMPTWFPALKTEIEFQNGATRIIESSNAEASASMEIAAKGEAPRVAG